MKFFQKLANSQRPDGLDPEGLRRSTRGEGRKEHGMSGDRVREQAERLHELAVLSLFLHSAGTMDEMLALFLERSPRVTGAVVTYPLLLDKRREVLSAMHLSMVDDRGLDQASMAADENLADLEYPLPLRSWRRSVMEGGEVTIAGDLKDALGDVLSKETCDKIRTRLEITKVAVVPLVMEGESFGICIFMFSGTEPDVEILELAAGHCTLALKDLVGDETSRFGGIDPVTWAHSRQHFMEMLESEITRSQRYGRGLSVVFFDIADFGEFNTNYGHTLGDRLLRATAMSLAGSVSAPEMVARYGGDDFAVLLPESDRAMAVELTAHMVDRLDNLSVFETETGAPAGVPVCVAIVNYPEDGSSREELLTAAEIALEQAKNEYAEAKLPQRQLTPVQQLRLANRRRTA